MVDVLSSLPSGMFDVYVYGAGKSAETLTLLLNEAGEQVLQDFLGHELERKVGSYVEEAGMSISRLYS